jgi:hypothetical protein
METVKFVYNETQVDFLPVGNDSLMINATQMAKIFNKKIENFTRMESTQNFISECLKNANQRYLNINDATELLDSKQKSGTWMHRILALKFAAWLDPAFELWVYATIDKIVFGFYKEIKEATVEKLKAEKLQQLKKQELMEKYPDLSEYFELEDRITTAQRNRMKAVKDSVNQLRMDLFN